MDFRLQALLAALERERVEYAIFGGIALNLHGLARFTEDLGLFAARSGAVGGTSVSDRATGWG